MAEKEIKAAEMTENDVQEAVSTENDSRENDVKAIDAKEPKAETENKTERELLAELVRLQKKSAKRMRIMAIGVVAIAIALGITAGVLVPRVTYTLTQADLLIQQTDTLISETEELVSGTNELVAGANDSLSGIDKMVNNVNDLVEENMETVTESIGKINEIDFEKLNQSIAELSDVLEPLANFANLFKR